MVPAGTARFERRITQRTKGGSPEGKKVAFARTFKETSVKKMDKKTRGKFKNVKNNIFAKNIALNNHVLCIIGIHGGKN